MTNAEAIERIKDHIEVHKYHETNAIKILEALNMAIKALEAQEWIPCKERLPDGKEHVLVTDYGETNIGRRFCGRW